MTKQQEARVERLRKEAENQFNHTEIKRFEVRDYDHFVSVYVVIGMPDDDGTLAAVFCRDAAHVFVGKRGGVTYPVSKQYKNGTWKHYTKPYRSFLSTSLDQRA